MLRRIVPFIAAALATTTLSHAQERLVAVAELTGCDDPDVSGIVRLRELPSDEGVKTVLVTLEVQGLSDGAHAVHIHETAACEPCSAANGHFDPGPESNTNPDGNHPFHSGDLINVNVEGGVGFMRTVTSRVTLSDGPIGLFDDDGASIIVHTGSDTYCPDGVESGCAGGARAACGILELVD